MSQWPVSLILESFKYRNNIHIQNYILHQEYIIRKVSNCPLELHSNPFKTDTYGTEITVLYIEVSPTQGVSGALHETGHTHKIMRGNHVDRYIVCLGI